MIEKHARAREAPTAAECAEEIAKILLELPTAAVSIFVGEPDRGKSTLAAATCERLKDALPGAVAIVDADVGQSEIGPPGTIGVAWAAAEQQRLRQLPAAATFFVGALTPRALPIEWLAAAVAAVRWAASRGARQILVDTPGAVGGAGARRLYAALALACPAAAVFGIGRDDAATAGVATAMAAQAGARLLWAPPPAGVQRRSAPQRALFRRTRLFAALDGGAVHRFALESPLEQASTVRTCRTLGATLGSGVAVAGHLSRWIGETLSLRVAAAEIEAGTLHIFVDSPAPIADSWVKRGAAVTRHFQVETIRVVSLAALSGAYVGLIGANGVAVGVGRFEAYLADQRELQVYSRVSKALAAEVSAVSFGRIRIGRDGGYLGDLKTAEM